MTEVFHSFCQQEKFPKGSNAFSGDFGRYPKGSMYLFWKARKIFQRLRYFFKQFPKYPKGSNHLVCEFRNFRKTQTIRFGGFGTSERGKPFGLEVSGTSEIGKPFGLDGSETPESVLYFYIRP